MADLTVTAAQVGMLDPQKCETWNFRAGATITAGQAIYQNSSGRGDLADASVAGTAGFRGIALNGGGAGQAITVLKKGAVYGFGVSGLAYDLEIFLSDTAGALADAAGTVSTHAGRVVSVSDNDATKVLYVEASW